MMRALLISLLLMITAQPALADELRAHMSEHTLDVGGAKRWYLIYEPETYKAGNPAVLLLHGGTQSMRKIVSKGAGGTNRWLDIADKEGVLIVIPNGTNAEGVADGNKQMWNDLRVVKGKLKPKADDVGFLSALLDEVIRTYKVDATRIYVTGASNGGMMTYRLLVDMPERFAAGAAFIANLPKDSPDLHVPEIPTPLFIMNGTEDPLVKWYGGEISRGRGEVISTPQTVAWWAKVNKADASNAETVKLPDTDKDDSCTLTKQKYKALPGGADMVFYTMQGGGHSMPSAQYRIHKLISWVVLGKACRDAEGADLAWDFMKHYTRKQ